MAAISPGPTPALSLSDADAARIEAEATQPPRDVGIPVTHWSAALLGEHVRGQGYSVSDRTVSRILEQAALQALGDPDVLTGSHAEVDEGWGVGGGRIRSGATDRTR